MRTAGSPNRRGGTQTMSSFDATPVLAIALPTRRGCCRSVLAAVLLSTVAVMQAPPAVHAQAAAKPNIMFIMGDDIGWMQPSIYHRGLMVGETPNIDRIGNEGAIFMDYVAMQSCTSGR